MAEAQRFVLGIAYQAGPDPRIKRGVDGGRDWFSKEELERACWSYMRSGCPQINAFHVDGTEDCAEPVESFIWRWDDWDVGDGIVVKDGDWCLGAVLSPAMWELHKAGKVNGLSPQGTGRRRRVRKEGAVALAKGSADSAGEDDDEFTEMFDANVPKVALVSQGANGIPRFLISKQQDGVALFDPADVRELIGKSEPEPPAPQEAITLSGSPAAMAAFIHGAPVRKTAAAEPDPVEKAEASTASMNDRPDSDFAYIEPGGTKDESGKTTPRSLRHFPIYDAAHVRNALSRAPQSPFGDKAMPKIRAAAKRFGIDVSKEQSVSTPAGVSKDALTPVVTGDTDSGVDGMDPTVVLAEPEDDAPGDAMEPGTPAWEAIDAATARKWTSIAVRLKNALGVMAERELLEAATADPDDAESAWDLQDAQCAIDYVIDTLAGFAVDEQAEAELGGEALEAVGKALSGFDPACLDTFEALAPVRKAGRVLSASNEAAIRGAVESLQKVLASLPAAPDAPQAGQPAAMEKEGAVTDAEQPETADAPTTDAAETPVEKAKGDPQLVVYDQKGKLLGIVAPADLTPVANGDSSDAADETTDAAPEPAAAPAVTDAALIPGTDTVASPPPATQDDTDQVAKAVQAGLAPLLTEVLGPLAARLDEQAERHQALADRLNEHSALADVVKALQERVENLAKMPDDRKPPLLNGATGTAGMATRDGTALAPYADLEKAVAEAGSPGARRDAEQALAYAKVRDRFR